MKRVRQRVRKSLEGFPRADDVQLVASELAGNICRHGSGKGYELCLDWGDDFVYIELVADGGPGLVVPVVPLVADVEDEAGRGLWLVANFSDSHGHHERHGLGIDFAEFWGADFAAAVNTRAAWLTWVAGHPRRYLDESGDRRG